MLVANRAKKCHLCLWTKTKFRIIIIYDSIQVRFPARLWIFFKFKNIVLVNTYR